MEIESGTLNDVVHYFLTYHVYRLTHTLQVISDSSDKVSVSPTGDSSVWILLVPIIVTLFILLLGYFECFGFSP